MKKTAVLIMICVLVLAMTACSAFQPEAENHVKDMMSALAANDLTSAMQLMHPDAEMTESELEAAIAQMCILVDGNAAKEFGQQSINKSTSTMNGISQKTETGTVRITLENDTVYHIDYIYLTSAKGSGFTSFRLSVGA